MIDPDDGTDFEPESGPFCVHWSTFGECEDMCKCGHPCSKHEGGYPGEPCEACLDQGTYCAQFEEATPANGT